jgi:hypothetical protein
MSLIPDYNNKIPRFTWGKFRDASIEVIIKHDPKYIVWCLNFLEFMRTYEDFILKRWSEIWPNEDPRAYGKAGKA